VEFSDPIQCSLCTLINAPGDRLCSACGTTLVFQDDANWGGKKGILTTLAAKEKKTFVLSQQNKLMNLCSTPSGHPVLGPGDTIEWGVKERTKKARGETKMYQKLIKLQELENRAETEARERRILIRKQTFGLSLQSLTLRQMCFITLIETCTEAKECIQILSEMGSLMFSFAPLEEHCLVVLTEQFSTSIFGLNRDPREKDSESNEPVDKELMRQLGVHYHGGREHLVLQEFNLFMDLPKKLQNIVLDNAWTSLHQEDVKARTKTLHFLKGCHTPMEPKRKHELKKSGVLKEEYNLLTMKKFRFFDFCLWFGFREEDALLGKILSDGVNPFPHGFLDFSSCLSRDKEETCSFPSSRKYWEPERKGKGKEPLYERETNVPNSPTLSPENAAWFYDKAFRHNLFALEDFMERYIKNHWLAVVEDSSWGIVPIERRNMLDAEHTKEMVEYYQKETARHEIDQIEVMIDWNESEEYDEEWSNE
jgi:hypothetical protein